MDKLEVTLYDKRFANIHKYEPLKCKKYDSTLFKGCGLLKELKIDHWIAAGTALGIHRDGDLIQWDTDIDIEIVANDKLPLLLNIFSKNGFKLIREMTFGGIPMQYCFLDKETRVLFDIYIFYKNRDKLFNWNDYGRMTIPPQFKLGKTIYKGHSLYSLLPLNKYLDFRYGKSWKRSKGRKEGWKSDANPKIFDFTFEQSSLFDQNKIMFQIYFDRGNGFNEKDSIKIGYETNKEITLSKIIHINSKLKRIRIDPSNCSGLVRFHGFDILMNGETLYSVNSPSQSNILFQNLIPLQENGTFICSNNDPMIYFNMPYIKCSLLEIVCHLEFFPVNEKILASVNKLQIINELKDEQFKEKDAHIGILETAVKDKDVHIRNLEGIIKDNSANISNLETAITDKDVHIRNIESSLRNIESSFIYKAGNVISMPLAAIRKYFDHILRSIKVRS